MFNLDYKKRLVLLISVFVTGVLNTPNASAQFCFMLGRSVCASACRNDLEGVREAIKTADADDITCAFSASATPEMQTALVQLGANVNSQTQRSYRNSPSGRTALFRVIFKENLSLFYNLLRLGVNTNIPDSRGTTPLMYAAAAGQLEMVTALLLANSNINAVDKSGRSALCYANMYFLNFHRDEIRSLLQTRGVTCSEP